MCQRNRNRNRNRDRLLATEFFVQSPSFCNLFLSRSKLQIILYPMRNTYIYRYIHIYIGRLSDQCKNQKYLEEPNANLSYSKITFAEFQEF